MKGKLKKVLIAMLTLAMVGANLVGDATMVYAAKATAIVVDGKIENSALALVPGEVKHIRVPVKAIGDALNDASVIVTGDSSAPFSISQASVTLENQSAINYVSNYGTTYIDFDVTVKETAKIGSYPITIKITGRDKSEDLNDPSYSLSVSINLQVLKELAPAQITLSDANVKAPIIGGETMVTFTLKNEGEMIARGTYYSIDYGTTNIAPGYDVPKIKIGDMAPGDTKYVALPISILSTATEGLKTLTVNEEYKDSDGTKGTDSQQIYVNVKKDEKAPELMVDELTYSGEIKPGADITVKTVLRNYGATRAENITVKVDDATTGADGFFKNYFTDSIYVGGIKADGKIEAKIPLTVSNQATGGNKKLNLIIAYEDTNGNKYTSTVTIYPKVIGAATAAESGLVVTNVNQQPEKPVAGDNMSVSFDLKNESKNDITEVKVALQGLDGTTFIPVDSEPYQLINKIEAGKSKKVTIPLTLSNNIPEGLCNLSVKITYTGSTASDPITIPIKNIQNDLGSNSKPKLTISKYGVEPEQLRAGSSFSFIFDVYNTHSSIAAKNITITLSQQDNIFTPTQGSNSFFIEKIAAGESVQEKVELKVKSDATTKAYPLKITIEYEYDGIKANPQTGIIGETKTVEISLQAIENARPVVDDPQVYSWDGNVVVDSPATCSFAFYNMGKSVLNNVIATVEGDFKKADGSMKYIGNVNAGESQYVEFDVTPMVEGTAKGVLRISYEDSNGDKIEFTKEFQQQVGTAVAFDPGMQGGAMDAFNPGMPLAKKEIMPILAFILMQIAVAVIFIPVTRKVIISRHKVKIRKKEQEQY